MIAVLKGDIIGSRSISQPELWLKPLKEYFKKWGQTPAAWEITGGDGFQLKIKNPEEGLQTAIEIKALLKSTSLPEKNAGLDARLAIGIGDETYAARRISESNGPAYVYAGDVFDTMRREKTTMLQQSPFADFDAEINLMLKLAGIYMDNWSVPSATLAWLVLTNSGVTQEWLGKQLSISQSSVSGRWTRSHISETMALIAHFRRRLNTLLS